jgi:hypothetical protein
LLDPTLKQARRQKRVLVLEALPQDQVGRADAGFVLRPVSEQSAELNGQSIEVELLDVLTEFA